MAKLSERLYRLEVALAGTFLILMVAMIFTGGVARMMRMPINITIDLATCFFAWATFLAADIAWRRDLLISVRLYHHRLPPRAARALELANYAIVLLILGYGVYAGAWLCWISRARSFQGMPGVSYSWVTAALPVGSALMIGTTLAKIRGVLRDRDADGQAGGRTG